MLKKIMFSGAETGSRGKKILEPEPPETGGL